MNRIPVPEHALRSLLPTAHPSIQKFVSGRYNGLRLHSDGEFAGYTSSKSYYSSGFTGRETARECLEDGGSVYERDLNGFVWQLVLGPEQEKPKYEHDDHRVELKRKPTPWWERHYTLDTRVCAPACEAPLPVPQEIVVDSDRGSRGQIRVRLWHELAADQEAKRREEVLELRRFVRRDITGMGE